MSDTDASGLWPNPDTLAAGDEELVVPEDDWAPESEVLGNREVQDAIKQATADFERWKSTFDSEQSRPFQEDGHLAADDYDRRHPNADNR